LKFSELFGPISAPDVFIPRKKQKVAHRSDALTYESDDVQKFRVAKVTTEEPEVVEEVPEESAEVKAMATAFSDQLFIGKMLCSIFSLFENSGKIPETVLKPLEQYDWQDKVAWDPSQAMELRAVTSFNLMTPGATPGPTPGPQATPEIIPNFPKKETFFIPKPKKPVKFIEPEPLLSKSNRKGMLEIS
jgi:hypothetical protein